MKTIPFFKQEVEKFQYYQMPKWLFREEYAGLSLNAKVAYSILFDRMSLSLKNEWTDEDGKVFIYFSNDKFADMLGCSKPTLINAKKELAKVGLLKEVRQGLTLPNRIYLFSPKFLGQEVKNLNSRSKNILVLDDKNFNTNKTEKSKTEYSNNVNDDMGLILTSFQKAFRGHSPTPFQFEDLQKYLAEDKMCAEIIVEAIKRTSNNSANYSYLQGILNNWSRKEIKTMEQVLAEDAAFERRKSNRPTHVAKESNIPPWALEETVATEMTEEDKAKMEDLKRQMLEREKQK